jgi:hypothetical protein
MDQMRAVGPIAVGPNAASELQQFADRMVPAVLEGLGTFELVRAFGEYWAREFLPLYETTPAGLSAYEQLDGDRPVQDTLAEQAAAATAASPPTGQPADTDQDAATAQTASVMVCPMCNGAGDVEDGDIGERASCPMCHGNRVVGAVGT